MTQFALSARPTSAALVALNHAISTDRVSLPDDGRVLFLRARDGLWWGEGSRRDWLCQQSFKPFAAALERSSLAVAEPSAEQRFPLVMLLPPRQRDEAKALFARAARHAEPGATIIAAIANDEGARSGEADFRKLFGRIEVLSKHHCRVFWSTLDDQALDSSLATDWQQLGATREIAEGRFFSRPGLFAWNRIDPASALLAKHLPADLHGRVADLGAGYGYLACEVLRRCVRVDSIDLYEAESRAVEPAQLNIQATLEQIGRPVKTSIHWHDVCAGLPARYDVIVSNPPFHQGRADQPELGQAFISAAANALHADGQLLLVANRHLPYESTLKGHFTRVEVLALKQGFKVFHASGIRR